MITKEEISKFYKDVEDLGLRFPVAVIAKMTGESKGNVSNYLKRRKEPSESFIERFYKGFKKADEENGHATIMTGNKQDLDLVKHLQTKIEAQYEVRIKELKEDKAFLQEILKTSLARIIEEQGTMLAYQKAWVDQHAEEKANGDQYLEREIKAKMSRRVGEHELGPVNKGTLSAGSK